MPLGQVYVAGNSTMYIGLHVAPDAALEQKNFLSTLTQILLMIYL